MPAGLELGVAADLVIGGEVGTADGDGEGLLPLVQEQRTSAQVTSTARREPWRQANEGPAFREFSIGKATFTSLTLVRCGYSAI